MTHIDVHKTNARLKQGNLQLIDVRTPAEFEGKHIPGSVLVPLNELSDYAGELEEVGRPLALVCRSGNRAEQARKLLAKEGISDVRVLKGGIKAWEAAGEPLKKGRQRWSLNRQVRFVAGSLVLAGTALGALVHPAFYGLSAFVGAGLTFSGITDTCGMAMALSRLPYNQAAKQKSPKDTLEKMKTSLA